MGVIVSPEPERDSEYWRNLADEAHQRERAERQTRSDQARRAADAAREKTRHALETWSAAVEARDRRRRIAGLSIAGTGGVAGLLLLFWASRLHGFWEKLWDGLGTAMLVAATVEVAARIVGKMIRSTQGKVDDDWGVYLKEIGDNVSAISTDLMLASLEREGAEADARDFENAKQKALLTERHDRMMATPSKTPADQRILESIARTLAAIPEVPDSYYYRARADLNSDKEREQLRHRIQNGNPDSNPD
jgi:hypothetical protein